MGYNLHDGICTCVHMSSYTRTATQKKNTHTQTHKHKWMNINNIMKQKNKHTKQNIQNNKTFNNKTLHFQTQKYTFKHKFIQQKHKKKKHVQKQITCLQEISFQNMFLKCACSRNRCFITHIHLHKTHIFIESP